MVGVSERAIVGVSNTAVIVVRVSWDALPRLIGFSGALLLLSI